MDSFVMGFACGAMCSAVIVGLTGVWLLRHNDLWWRAQYQRLDELFDRRCRAEVDQ